MTYSNLSAAEEEAAIQRALDKDVQAFNLLVLEYQNLAYSVARRMLSDEGSAGDAVQDSFVKAFRALHTFRGGSFKAWLMRIVTNTCYDALRARKTPPNREHRRFFPWNKSIWSA